jgi:hypothetical protein
VNVAIRLEPWNEHPRPVPEPTLRKRPETATWVRPGEFSREPSKEDLVVSFVAVKRVKGQGDPDQTSMDCLQLTY